MVALSDMAFKLTYTDGQEAEYDDKTVWEVDDGVLKLGRTEGDWSVLVSPSHWAVIEVGGAASRAEKDKDKDARTRTPRTTTVTPTTRTPTTRTEDDDKDEDKSDSDDGDKKDD